MLISPFLSKEKKIVETWKWKLRYFLIQLDKKQIGRIGVYLLKLNQIKQKQG
jgi:hypothetical protein